jgi:proliferating cell nuclear antigen
MIKKLKGIKYIFLLQINTMLLSITEKTKRDIFISLFQLLKAASSTVTIIFLEDHAYIQGMDSSHVCLFDAKIYNTWFDKYEICENDLKNICLNSQILHSILSMAQEQDSVTLHYEGDADSLEIDLTNAKGEFNKYFKIPLIDMESDLLEIPSVEYDVEFSIKAKKMNELISQLATFGDVINIKCTEEKIDLISKGDGGEMLVNIPIDDLSEFSISEGQVIDISYSLNYINKMCITTKLSPEIEWSISADIPLKIKYDLGDNSSIMFFIAPKIE